MQRCFAKLATIGLIVLAAAPPAWAHRFGRSYSDIELAPHGAYVYLDVDPNDFVAALRSRFDLDHSGDVDAGEIEQRQKALAEVMAAGLVLTRGGTRCTPQIRARHVSPAAHMLRATLYYACPAAGGLQVAFPLIDRMRPGHAHLLTVRLKHAVTGGIIDAAHPTWSEPGAGSVWQSMTRFVGFGMEHILLGYDHLLFLLALLLVSTRLGELLRLITAFTAAHSLTLIVAALGVLRLPSHVTEPAIAATIVYVGLENFFVKDARGRWRITFALGLIHGFGFASALNLSGLSTATKVASLLSFNVGVELGQLCVVLLIIPALGALRRSDVSLRARVVIWLGGVALAAGLWSVEPITAGGLALLTTAAVILTPRFGYETVMLRDGSALVVALGAFWFVQRVFFP